MLYKFPVDWVVNTKFTTWQTVYIPSCIHFYFLLQNQWVSFNWLNLVQSILGGSKFMFVQIIRVTFLTKGTHSDLVKLRSQLSKILLQIQPIVANHVQNVRSSPSDGRIWGSYAESVTMALDDDFNQTWLKNLESLGEVNWCLFN